MQRTSTYFVRSGFCVLNTHEYVLVWTYSVFYVYVRIMCTRYVYYRAPNFEHIRHICMYLDEVYAFLRAARWRARSWSCTAGLLLLSYWTLSTLSFAPPGGVRGAGAGRLLLAPDGTRSTPSLTPPSGVIRSGAGLLMLPPYWMRSTPSFAPPVCGRGADRARPYWMKSMPPFAPPGCDSCARGTGAGLLLLQQCCYTPGRADFGPPPPFGDGG